MPIYSIDLHAPTNFSRLPSFKKAAIGAKEVWQRELGQEGELIAKKNTLIAP